MCCSEKVARSRVRMDNKLDSNNAWHLHNMFHLQSACIRIMNPDNIAISMLISRFNTEKGNVLTSGPWKELEEESASWLPLQSREQERNLSLEDVV